MEEHDGFSLSADVGGGNKSGGAASLGPGSSEESPSDLVILHFNDVYEVESRKEEPVGGAARYKAPQGSGRET